MEKKYAILAVVFLFIFGLSQAQDHHRKEKRIERIASGQLPQKTNQAQGLLETKDLTKSGEVCTVLFSWVLEDDGQADYSMTGTMTFDPAQAIGGAVSAEGISYGDFNNGIIDLSVSFYLDGSLIETIINVENGVVGYDDLEVYFNIDTGEFEDGFDMGRYSDSPDPGDDLNLYGDIGAEFYFLDEANNVDYSTNGGLVVSVDDVACQDPAVVPLSRMAFLLGLLLMTGFVFFRLR